MVYNTVDDIYGEIDGTRDRIYDRVEGLSSEQATYRLQPGSWSVLDLVEHVCMTEAAVTMRISKLLTQAESEGASGSMSPFSFDDIGKLAEGKKFNAPEAVHPVGASSLAEVVTRMRAGRESLRGLRSRLESVNASAVTYPHPAFGPLNPYQWLALAGFHEDRHLAQVEAIIASPSFPSA
ncbi:MAG TPA: DinB family protein [Blastocatellia bacterium]